jgi:Na+-transporting methylmalonyl-CoA/oxaloacetate decarboxylase gamma subunit
MKKIKRSVALVIAMTLVLGLFTLTAFAAEKLDQNMSGADMSFGERFEYAIQGTVTGMLMVFAVLGLLFGIVTLSRVFLYDIPNKKKARLTPVKTAQKTDSDPKKVPENVIIIHDTDKPREDDGELVAVITAAIAAMIESNEEYKNEFAGGFRVVSFKRSTTGAWNRK